jgi:hypothetical protein
MAASGYAARHRRESGLHSVSNPTDGNPAGIECLLYKAPKKLSDGSPVFKNLGFKKLILEALEKFPATLTSARWGQRARD